MSNDGAYNLAITHPMHGLGAMAVGGLLMDWETIPDVDITKPYWNAACNDSLEINGRQYYAFSDMIFSDVFCVYFNKDMITENHLENPYDLMRGNQWTFDKMTEMASVVKVDLNGDGIMDVNDQYGFTTVLDFPLCITMYASGIRLCEPKTFRLSIYNDRMLSLIDKMHFLLNRSGVTYKWTYEGEAEDRMYVADGKALFEFELSDRLLQDRYRNAAVNFGLVPYPKLDTDQEDYGTTDYSGLLCVPKSVKNVVMTGQAIELLSYYSGETTIPAYYDKLLGEKLASDKDMREMLSYLFDHIIFDGGQRFFGIRDSSIHSTKSMQKLYYTVMYLVGEQKSTAFGSYYEENRDAAETLIEEFLEAVEEQQ
jgi:ABC-type glycerol-3-phosphate transport system substrate-binding protein